MKLLFTEEEKQVLRESKNGLKSPEYIESLDFEILEEPHDCDPMGTFGVNAVKIAAGSLFMEFKVRDRKLRLHPTLAKISLEVENLYINTAEGKIDFAKPGICSACNRYDLLYSKNMCEACVHKQYLLSFKNNSK